MATKNQDQGASAPGTEQGIGELDMSGWEEQVAVTGRPNDTPLRGDDEPAVPNATFRERAENRMVASAEEKSLTSMTKSELQEEADRRGVEVPSGATKAEILEALGG